MNSNRVLSGVATWSVGLVIPLLYHVLLISGSVEKVYFTQFDSVVSAFFELPWVIWLYLIAMTVVGTIRVVSGLKRNTEK